MSESVFIRSGNGYAEDKTFDDLTVLAAPLCGPGAGDKFLAGNRGRFGTEARESRVFKRPNGGTDYGSHIMRLGTMEYSRDLYLMVEHGGGTELWRLPQFYDGGAFREYLLAMPERIQYAALYSIYSLAREARRQAQSEISREWAQAFIDGRIKKGRAKGGRYHVTIEPKKEPTPCASS